MNLVLLFRVNALAMLAAGIALFAAPGFMAGVIGIRVQPEAYFLAYLLGASELGFAVLCAFGTRLKDAEALHGLCVACIVFHAASGIAGVLAAAQGVSGVVLWNVAVRVVMVGLFAYFGFSRTPVRIVRR